MPVTVPANNFLPSPVLVKLFYAGRDCYLLVAQGFTIT